MSIFSKLFGSYLPPGNIARIEYAIRILMALVAGISVPTQARHTFSECCRQPIMFCCR